MERAKAAVLNGVDPPPKDNFPNCFHYGFHTKRVGFGQDIGKERREDGAAPRFRLRKLQNEEPCWPWLLGCKDGTERTKAVVPQSGVPSPPQKAIPPNCFHYGFQAK